jgi:copper homeostasis protein
MAGLLNRPSAGPGRTTPDLEFAVEDATGVRTAATVGATRVELCAALCATGGLTPSIGMVEKACGAGLPVHVLVRPRPGGFVYAVEELEVIERDIVAVLRAGASGVVVGALAPDGGPDVDALIRLIAVVRAEKPGAEVTFHRAFDAALSGGTDPADALRRLSLAGVDRVLTSGGGVDCGEGLGMLARLVELGREHAPRVQIMAGGGVTVDVVPRLVEAGVHAVHSSGRRRPATPNQRPANPVPTDPPDTMDPELAADIAAALRARAMAHGA